MEFTDSIFLNQTRTQAWNDQKMQETRAILFRGCEDNESMEILEVGCGNGLITAFMAEGQPKHQFTGVDLDTDLVREAKLRNKKDNIANLKFCVEDINKVNYQEYDMVYTHCTLVDTKDSKQLFDAVYQAVKNNGIICCIEPLYQCDCNNVHIPALDENDKEVMSRILKKILIDIPKSRGIDRLYAMKIPNVFHSYRIKQIEIEVISTFEYCKNYDKNRKQRIIESSNYVLNYIDRYYNDMKQHKLYSLLDEKSIEDYCGIQYKISEYIIRNPDEYFRQGNFTYGNMLIIKGIKTELRKER